MDKTTADYFIDWYSNAFGFGYGTGDIHYCNALMDFFSHLTYTDVDDWPPRVCDYEEMEKVIEPATYWFLLNVLCDKDIVEYGTSPRYGWLTNKGKGMRDFLKDYDADKLYNLVMVDQDYDHCYPDYCNHTDRGNKGCINPFWSKSGI